jgi:ribosomal protein S18 acetylase RimI-like enzyme
MPRTRQGFIDSGVGLRSCTPSDEPFLYAVYASTRTDELASVPWTDAQKDAFVRMQFAAQHQQYRTVFPDAEFSVVLCDGQPIGRQYVQRAEREILLVDIALLADYRGRGIGTQLISALLAEGAAADKSVRLHVEAHNPARQLYARLGFRMDSETDVYVSMQWQPPGGQL